MNSSTRSPVSGLQYLRARWYDPQSGRFNRLDPYFGDTSSPLSFHKYAYGHMNPVGNIDPTGMFITLDVLLSLMTQQSSRSSGLVANAPAAQFAGSSAQSFQAAIHLMRTIAQQGLKNVVKKGIKHLVKNLDKAAKKQLKDFKDIVRKGNLFPVVEEGYPSVYDHHVTALAKGMPRLLVRHGETTNKQGVKKSIKQLSRANRSVAHTVANQTLVGQKTEENNSLDEYPYASTKQGGKDKKISVKYVKARDNSSHGGQLGGFYTALGRGNKPILFAVVLLSIDFLAQD